MAYHISDCLAHHKKQCFQCNYEKSCDGLKAQQRQPIDCNVLTITEYEELVASKTQYLQNQVSTAIDEAIDEMDKKQSELSAQIKSDPRNSAPKISIEIKIGMQEFGFWVLMNFRNEFSKFSLVISDEDQTDDCLFVIREEGLVQRSNVA